MIRTLRTGGFWAAVSVSLASGALCADDRQNLDQGWPARWSKTGPVETAAIGGLATTALLMDLLWNPPSTPRWAKPILFDPGRKERSVRGVSGGALASRDRQRRRLRRPAALRVGGRGGPRDLAKTRQGRRRAGARAHQRGGAVDQRGAHPHHQRAVGRMRPDGAGTTDNTAFLSGHTSTTFTVASALCVQHSMLEIYGGGADGLVCPGALAVAAAT
jgi:hypothetical protein